MGILAREMRVTMMNLDVWISFTVLETRISKYASKQGYSNIYIYIYIHLYINTHGNKYVFIILYNFEN